MKVLFHKIISGILAVVLIIGVFAVSATAKTGYDGNVLLEVVETEAIIRSKPRQDSDVRVAVHKGDVLLGVSSKTNNHGNLWYECVYISTENGASKKTGWIYSEHVMQHRHQMIDVKNDNELQLSFCKCGHFEVNPQGIQQMYSAALPQGGQLIDPESVALALGALSQLGSMALQAVPYVAIPFAIGGIAYLAYVHCSTTTSEVIDVKRMTKEYRPSDYESGKYYYCATYKNKDETDGVYSSVLMLPSYEMNLDEAASYMKKVVYGTGLLKASVENFQVTIDSVYTPLEKDAKTLCEKLKFDGLAYGQSNKPNEKSEVDKLGEDKAPYWLYFEHYHLFRSKMGAASSMEKASGHIFFGIPFVNSYYQLGRY